MRSGPEKRASLSAALETGPDAPFLLPPEQVKVRPLAANSPSPLRSVGLLIEDQHKRGKHGSSLQLILRMGFHNLAYETSIVVGNAQEVDTRKELRDVDFQNIFTGLH